MFFASKLLSFATQPQAWAALIPFASLLLMSLRRGWGLTFCWLTSANRVPRAMAIFLKIGWNVTTHPVDFSSGTATLWSQYPLQKGAHKWHIALHKMLGLLTYRRPGVPELRTIHPQRD